MRDTILVAEDSEVIRMLLRTLLAERDYDVIEAADGHAALEAVRADHPDVVLMDVEMPGMDGYEVLAAMKADPLLEAIPVVFLTARTDPEEIVSALEAGAHDYLRKPFEAPELMARVFAAARVRRLQNELRALNQELESQAATDGLTGLHNRRSLDLHLSRAVAAAARHARPLAVLMIDIDHFKSINDTHGHHAGDAVLVSVARRLGERVRTEDVLGRWGGEEFMVITGETDETGAGTFAEHLRDCIRATPFAIGDSDLSVTASVGYAAWRGDSEEELVRRADRALYAAKDAGRDTVRGG